LSTDSEENRKLNRYESIMLMQPSRTSKLKNVHTDSNLNIFKVSEFIMGNFFVSSLKHEKTVNSFSVEKGDQGNLIFPIGYIFF